MSGQNSEFIFEKPSPTATPLPLPLTEFRRRPTTISAADYCTLMTNSEFIFENRSPTSNWIQASPDHHRSQFRPKTTAHWWPTLTTPLPLPRQHEIARIIFNESRANGLTSCRNTGQPTTFYGRLSPSLWQAHLNLPSTSLPPPEWAEFDRKLTKKKIWKLCGLKSQFLASIRLNTPASGSMLVVPTWVSGWGLQLPESSFIRRQILSNFKLGFCPIYLIVKNYTKNIIVM